LLQQVTNQMFDDLELRILNSEAIHHRVGMWDETVASFFAIQLST
jgi:hypothetical protein